ncbi:MAG: hypothetical protein D3904_14665 [Candidatus Electrothrix sp. EH2]|nr:hypothetical protein [Candidatus Electrothrix sp. EH2]
MLEYLESQSDFSFELKVLKMLKMLRENGIECEHGGHYEDPVTGKSREFDIRAKKSIQEFSVHMAIECKNIRDNFPILISCIPRHEQESYLIVVTKKRGYQGKLSIKTNSLYKAEELVGKSVVQVGRTKHDDSITAKDSELYEKWGQCLNSANDLVKKIALNGKETRSVLLPFVVVPDERLWVIAYDKEGRRIGDPKITDRCSCFIGKEYLFDPPCNIAPPTLQMKVGLEPPIQPLPSLHLQLSHLEVITFRGMQEFIERYLKTEEGMAQIFNDQGVDESL